MTKSTSRLSALLAAVIILTFISFALAQGQFQWGSPNSTISYQTGTLVPVLILGPDNTPVPLFQTCGQNPLVQLAFTDQFSFFQLPSLYTGNCTYSSPDPAMPLQPLVINVVGSSTVITFISPITTAPLTEYEAGSTVAFKYVISPEDSLPRNVIFSCSNSTLSPVSFYPIPNVPVQLQIPDDFYGNDCSFNFVQNNGSFSVANTAVVSVVPPPQTQTLIFVQVPGTIQQTIPFTVEISTDGTFPAGSFVNLGLFCDVGLSPDYQWFRVTLNQSVSLVLPAMTITTGSGCNLMAFSTAVSYFTDSQPSPVTITPPPPQTQALFFVQAPDTIQQTIPFNVAISTNGSPPLANTSSLGLFCDGDSSPVFQWYSVTLDQSVPLVLPSMTISPGIGCYLEALSTVPNLLDSQPSPVLIKLNIASPFGGDLVEITDPEAAIFLITVTGNLQSWYDIEEDTFENLVL